ncbi:MAG TPA: hypothetical protein VFY06_11370, partial [Verrucomicrobiae bacterium]|nr:hypothetical protein [Verrucomicrobiae bacterium]
MNRRASDMLAPMDEDKDRSRLWEWMEGNVCGRKVLDVLSLFRRVYHRHVDRYHVWNNTRYRICTWLVTIIAFILVLTAAAGAFRIGWRHYRHFEEARWQKEAQTFLDQGNYASAALSARKVLSVNQYSVPAARIMAQLADDARSPQAVDWLKRIAQIEPTTDNKLVLASVAMKYDSPPYALTLRILAELPPDATNSAKYHVVAGSLAMQTHDWAGAEAHYEAAARLEPTNKLFQMSIAIIRLNSTNQTEQAGARSVLKTMRSDEDLGPMALRALVSDRLSHGDAATAGIYSRQLVSSPHALLEDRLLNLEVLRRLKSDEFNERLGAVQQQVETNAVAVAEVAGWMQANGLVTGSLDWMTGLANSLLDQQPVQMALAQGYLQTGQWTKLLNITGQGNWRDQEYYRLALVYRAWSQLSAARAADANWSAAIANAAGSREALNQLLQLAQIWQLPAKEEAVLLEMVQEFPRDAQPRRELGRMYFSEGNTLGLHALYAVLVNQ